MVVAPFQDHDIGFTGKGVSVVGDSELASLTGGLDYLGLFINELGDLWRFTWFCSVTTSNLVNYGSSMELMRWVRLSEDARG